MKIKVERLRKNLFSGIFSALFMSVLAEEPNAEQTKVDNKEEEEITPPTPKEQDTPKPSGSVNFEDLVSKARAEEKAKLYPQIEKLKKDKNDLLLVVAERDKKISDLEKELKKATSETTKYKTELEDGTKTNQTVQELTLQYSQLEKEYEDLQSKYDTEIQNLKVNSFREKQIALAGGEIIEELVQGSTEEEVLASVEVAKQRYADIQAKALANVQMPRANPSSASMKIFADKSIDEIASMSNEEYKEYRKQLNIK